MRDAQLGLFWFCIASKIKISDNNPPCFQKVCTVLLWMLMGGAVVALVFFMRDVQPGLSWFFAASKMKISDNNPPRFQKVCMVLLWTLMGGAVMAWSWRIG